MKKIKMASIAALCAMLLAACDLFFGSSSTGGSGSNTKDPPEDISVLEEGSFYAQNMVTGAYYVVKADKLVEGQKCVIWAQKDSGVTMSLAREMADEYDTVIRPRIVDAFGRKNFDVDAGSEKHHFDDILDYANWLAGGDDGKLTILMLDIQDGYRGGNDGYVAGYFFSGNFRPQGRIEGYPDYSNGKDMMYVDTYPGLPSGPIENRKQTTYATFAHELQHLINYVTSILINRGPYNTTSLMDVWIDEGLSSQAEYLYLESNPTDKVRWFNLDQGGTIARGNNFFVWDNHSESSTAIHDDYATVYLFFRWLYLQADQELRSQIFYDIVQDSDNYDYRAVTGAANRINGSWNNWEDLLRTWLAANYYPKNPYGYTGDTYLQEMVKVNPVSGTSISLYPGEGVYSIINNSFTPGGTAANIRYAGLSDNNSTITTVPSYTGNVLLTFNANSNKGASAETGSLTGVQIPPSSSRTAAEQAFTGPYIMDARDVLNRNVK